MSFLNESPVAKITAAIIMIAPTIALLMGTIPEENLVIVTSLITLSGGFLFGSSVVNKLP